jgi:hypothetical protein
VVVQAGRTTANAKAGGKISIRAGEGASTDASNGGDGGKVERVLTAVVGDSGETQTGAIDEAAARARPVEIQAPQDEQVQRGAAARVDGEYNDWQNELQQEGDMQVRGQYIKTDLSYTSRRSSIIRGGRRREALNLLILIHRTTLRRHTTRWGGCYDHSTHILTPHVFITSLHRL